jgi:hypothetical protein
MTEPIPHADEADIAEQARSVDDGIDQYDSLSGEYGDGQQEDADGGLEGQLAASDFDD